MELKEAREIAKRIRIDRLLHDRATDDPPTRSGSAIIILDDRIKELEAQRDEQAEMIGDLVEIVESVDFENDDNAPSNEEMNRWHNAAIIEASDKEDKG